MTLLWKFAIAVTLVLALVGINGNRNRLDDVQKARLASCRQTYEGIRQVFEPFFEPPPRTAARQADIDKFNRTINQLKAQCATQTATQGGPS